MNKQINLILVKEFVISPYKVQPIFGWARPKFYSPDEISLKSEENISFIIESEMWHNSWISKAILRNCQLAWNCHVLQTLCFASFLFKKKALVPQLLCCTCLTYNFSLKMKQISFWNIYFYCKREQNYLCVSSFSYFSGDIFLHADIIRVTVGLHILLIAMN